MFEQFFRRLVVVLLVTVTSSVAISVISMIFMIGVIHPAGLAISIVAPILVGFPMTWIFERQNQKLKLAMDDLETTHGRLKLLNSELEEQANRDYLTGLLNRRYFAESLSEYWSRYETGVLLCLDVDNFKSINDTYGHAVGDQAIVAIASAVSRVVGDLGQLARIDGEQFIARVGGEEFAVFIPNATFVFAEQIAEAIRREVEITKFLASDQESRTMSVSIGSAFVIEANSFDSLVEIADKRMYDAKRNGKNRVAFPDQSSLAQVA